MADNKIRFGVSNSRYALETDEGYGDWVRIPGTVQVQIEPQESSTDFYADNYNYFTQPGAANDQITIELADLLDQAKIDLIGYRRKATGAGLVLPVNYKPSGFAYGFQVEGDQKALRVCIYGGKLNRPSNTYSTKNATTEPTTMSIQGKFTGKPFVVDGVEEPFLYYTSMEGDSDYDTFWDAVPTPGTEVSDTSLSALTIGGLTLSPEFSENVTTYTATTESSSDVITATATDSGATVSIKVDGVSVTSGSSATWSEGANVVSVVVTNGTATKAYTVIVTKS